MYLVIQAPSSDPQPEVNLNHETDHCRGLVYHIIIVFLTWRRSVPLQYSTENWRS